MIKLGMLNEIAISEWEGKRPDALFLDPDFEVLAPVRLPEMAMLARKLSNALLSVVNSQELPPELLQECLCALDPVYEYKQAHPSE